MNEFDSALADLRVAAKAALAAAKTEAQTRKAAHVLGVVIQFQLDEFDNHLQIQPYEKQEVPA